MKEKIKILAVEDNPTDAELLKRHLEKAGFNFDWMHVTTRKEYERALPEFKPDLVLADYHLPSLNGLEAFRIQQKKLPGIPFIIVSATIGEEKAVELIKSGVTDYALKDKIFTLGPKIERAIKEHEEEIEKKNADRKIKVQHEKLNEIAFLQSHQVRSPLASILGLIELIDFGNQKNPKNEKVFSNLKVALKDFDKVVRKIVDKTNDIENTEYDS
ncbi:MAG: response regulator [Bacteroidetes bacterium]|nr:response regulator [Bacteroidota bacterium]